jgi:hypothetical protein
MKKVQSTYTLVENHRWTVLLTKNEEDENSYSIHEYGEPCSGVIKHWASKEDHIALLERIIKELNKLKD